MKYEVNMDVTFLHQGHTEDGTIIDRGIGTITNRGVDNGRCVYSIIHRYNSFHNVHLVFEDDILGIVGCVAGRCMQ